MLDGIYNNAANLNMLERWQASISQNLASSQASGFKRTQFSVNSESTSKEGRDVGSATSLPKSQFRVDLSPGANRRTDKDTDIAIDGPGFFQIQGANGAMLYTRNGEFHIDASNKLVNSSGQALMGDGGPISINPDDGALTIAADGTLSQNNNTLGRVPLYDFARGDNDLNQIPGGFMAKAGVSPVLVEKPSLLQGAVEGSNVSPITEMINLIMVSNAYQSSQKLITSHDALMGQAIQTLGAPPA